MSGKNRHRFEEQIRLRKSLAVSGALNRRSTYDKPAAPLFQLFGDCFKNVKMKHAPKKTLETPVCGNSRRASHQPWGIAARFPQFRRPTAAVFLRHLSPKEAFLTFLTFLTLRAVWPLACPSITKEKQGDLANEFAPAFHPRNYLPLLLTFRLTVADLITAPLVPLIVKVKVPIVDFFVVETVRVEFPEPVTVVGLNVAVVFAGKPLTLKVMTPLNPFTAVTFAVYVVLPPFLTVCEAGVAERLKLDTTTVTDVECVRVPSDPVTVTV